MSITINEIAIALSVGAFLVFGVTALFTISDLNKRRSAGNHGRQPIDKVHPSDNVIKN